MIIFDKYNSVIITLPAQFGINPIKLDIKYVNKLLFSKRLETLSSPTLNIIKLITTLFYYHKTYRIDYKYY